MQQLKGVARVARERGLTGVRQEVARELSRRYLSTSLWEKYSDEARVLVSWLDFSPAELEASRAACAAFSEPVDVKSITWFLPDFDNAFYGGIHTILRFANYFSAAHGVKHQFVIVGNLAADEARQKVGAAFPALAGSRFVRVSSHHEFDQLEATDAGICTLWSTAYFLLRFNKVRRKCYFLQDYESLFYPAGSTSAQVEATYRFGFFGICNTPTLADIYTRQYGGHACGFMPAVDGAVFHANDRRPHGHAPPYKVFFYGRPGNPRNGFELGGAALTHLKERLKDRVEIVCAGAKWNPAEYGLGGTLTNLGMLKYEETGALYRTCDVGLVMMFTRHPSYLPFELMACGAAVVSNINAATTWFLKDNENCLLSEASASCLANAMERLLSETALRQRVAQGGIRHMLLHNREWSAEAELVWQKIARPHNPAA